MSPLPPDDCFTPMPAYRFCRTDDIAFLTDALNACYVVHLSDRKALADDDFKREIRELDIWCSSCMVALADGDPIAVVTGAKRERATLIHRIGVHPDFQRQGHARHLLESLSRKLSVLGPPRVVAEVPEDLPPVRGLFEALGYEAEQRFADFSLSQAPAVHPAEGEVGPASLDDLLRYGTLDASVCRSWERALETLRNRKDQIRGLAIASHTRVAAYVLYRDLPGRGRREILALGGATGPEAGSSDARVLLEIALRAACRAPSLSVTIPRVSEEEIPWTRLESLGFRRGRTYIRFAVSPGAGNH